MKSFYRRYVTVAAVCAAVMPTGGVEASGWYGYHPQSVLALGRGVSPQDVLAPKNRCLEFDWVSDGDAPPPPALAIQPISPGAVIAPVGPGIREERTGGGGALSTELGVYIVRSSDEYRRLLNVDVAAEASFLGIGRGSAAFDFDDSESRNRNSVTIVVRGKSEYSRRMTGAPRLLPFAQQWIDRGEIDRFIEVCGSHYVAAERRGANFAVEIRLDHLSRESRSKILASAGGGVSLGFVSASAQNSVTREIARASSQGHMSVRVVSDGGEGLSSLSETVPALASSPDPIRDILMAIGSFMRGFNAHNAAPMAYLVTPTPFLPMGMEMEMDAVKTERLLAMVRLFRRVNREGETLRAILDRSDSRASFFLPATLEAAASAASSLDTVLEQVRQAHRSCMAARESWPTVCRLPEISYPEPINVVIGTLHLLDLMNSESSDTDGQEKSTPYRQFRAEGVHQCWSDTSIGHECRVSNVGFSDCNEAFYRLRAEDCCPRTPGGGNTNDFRLVTCTNFF